MNQELLKQHKDQKAKVSPLKEKFEKIKDEVIQPPKTRQVKLLYTSTCGCGSMDIEIKRTVPFDSDLKDGDRISKLKAKDDLW